MTYVLQLADGPADQVLNVNRRAHIPATLLLPSSDQEEMVGCSDMRSEAAIRGAGAGRAKSRHDATMSLGQPGVIGVAG